MLRMSASEKPIGEEGRYLHGDIVMKCPIREAEDPEGKKLCGDMTETASLADRSLSCFYDDRYRGDYQTEVSRIDRYTVEAVLSRIPRDLASVLDYGCGQGSKILVLEEMFPNSRVFGIDISNEALEKARRRFPNCQFTLFDGNVSPFQSQVFDLVFSWHVLEHCRNLEETVNDMSRLVRDGAYLCAILPCGNPGSIAEKIARLVNGEELSMSGEMRWTYEDKGHLRRVKSEELVSRFENNGFDLVHDSYSGQSWGGVFYFGSCGPIFVNNVFAIRRGRTIADKARIAALKCAFLCASFPLFAMSFAHVDRITYLVRVKEWNEHNRERNGGEQFLVFKKRRWV